MSWFYNLAYYRIQLISNAAKHDKFLFIGKTLNVNSLYAGIIVIPCDTNPISRKNIQDKKKLSLF